MISAKLILKSLHPDTGVELITLQLMYPRFIHGELMTHRVFSRNAMSSRAAPVQKMIDQVKDDPVIPLHWGANQPGMQADAELGEHERKIVEGAWRMAAKNAANAAQVMSDFGLHKQIANRVLEPFQWMHTIVTATEWQNFFDLRLTPAVEPHMRKLAEAMHDAIESSPAIPRKLHVPYVAPEEFKQFEDTDEDALMRVSAARCARVSYSNHDGTAPDFMKDMALARKLATSRHASPFEHCAVAQEGDLLDEIGSHKWFANFRSWRSLRHMMRL